MMSLDYGTAKGIRLIKCYDSVRNLKSMHLSLLNHRNSMLKIQPAITER